MFVLMTDFRPPPAHAWPRPPACLRAADLDRPPEGARVAVAGLVLVRQRPGTAKGVIFITLEDETGVVNVIVWKKLYERFRRAVIAGRCLRVTGRLQREGGITHVIAEEVEDISWMLDDLLRPETLAPAPAPPCGEKDSAAASSPGPGLAQPDAAR
jgi:DNA polymerase III alpha subunit